MADITVQIVSGAIVVVDLNRGYSGFSGRSGYSGFSGSNPGASGYSGFSGLSGFSGKSGYSGYSGVGTSGFSGRSGYSGFSGAPVGGGAWASWTPTWTNLTVGNGTVNAKYTQIGKAVFGRLSLVLGGTSSISGAVAFSLPVTSVAYGGSGDATPIGVGIALQHGLNTYRFSVNWNNTTTATIEVEVASGTYVILSAITATVPFTFGTSDEINCEFFYEAA